MQLTRVLFVEPDDLLLGFATLVSNTYYAAVLPNPVIKYNPHYNGQYHDAAHHRSRLGGLSGHSAPNHGSHEDADTPRQSRLSPFHPGRTSRMEDVKRRIVDYYADYDEEGRLERHPVEFVATMRLLRHFVKTPGRMLDAAAGTGRYSFAFAALRHSVWAEDISPRNVDAMKSKLASADGGLKISVRVNDAHDLGAYADGFFNTVLLMGPVYHYPIDESLLIVKEASRVLDSAGGIIAIAFVNRYTGRENDEYAHMMHFHSASEIEDLLGRAELTAMTIAPTDGPRYDELSALLHDESQHEEAAESWLDSNLADICDGSGIDDCIHGLAIARMHSRE